MHMWPTKYPPGSVKKLVKELKKTANMSKTSSVPNWCNVPVSAFSRPCPCSGVKPSP